MFQLLNKIQLQQLEIFVCNFNGYVVFIIECEYYIRFPTYLYAKCNDFDFSAENKLTKQVYTLEYKSKYFCCITGLKQAFEEGYALSKLYLLFGFLIKVHA